jgi:ankyrin repeat protein
MAHGGAEGSVPLQPIEEPRTFGSVVRAASVGDDGHLAHALGEDPAAAQKAAAQKDEYGCDAVSWAARNGRQAVVGMLVKKEVDLESKSFGGMRPLHHAVNSNEEVIIKELLAKGVDANAVDESGNTPLHYGCRRGVMGICQILVDRKGDVTAKNALGMTPLHVACNNGHASVVQYLLSKDAEPNECVARAPLARARTRGGKGRAGLLSFLFLAQRTLDLRTCSDRTEGALLRQLAVADLLPARFSTSSESPPPSPSILPRCRADKNGNTPLHVAARTGFRDVAKLLIAAGAKPTSNRAGKTPDQLCEGEMAAMIAALI